ncbi:hypothetical protein ACSHWO_31455 [Streptomyces sp. HUAS TT3]|uniref:hypothetical protein n=1 Tax=Streptomyces sp. HUAS TT3 TaxID=3447510 RepID=UPI003F65A966
MPLVRPDWESSCALPASAGGSTSATCGRRAPRSTGLGTGASLRRRMALATGVAPLAHRRTFRAKASAGAGS